MNLDTSCFLRRNTTGLLTGDITCNHRIDHSSEKPTKRREMSQYNKLYANGHLSTDVPAISEPNSPLSPMQRPSRKRTRSDASMDLGSGQLSTVLEATPLGKESSRIRILRLHGGTGDYLEANLQIHDPNTTYEALSYTWGAAKDLSTIRIVQDNEIYDIPIKTNLYQALRQLRYKGKNKPRLLWVDAVCINQKDHNEKNHQVPKMASIYNEAKNVCVWLGNGSESSERALELIKRVVNLDEFERLIEDEKSAKDWDALLELLKRPWFSRRWVVQEIALARDATVHCGEVYVRWRDFANAVALFGSRHPQISRLFQGSSAFHHQPDYLGDVTALAAYRLVQQSSNLFRKSDDGKIQEHLLSLETLVSILSPFEATKAHDTVYAVLSLAEDTGPRFSVRPARDNPTEPEELIQEHAAPLSAQDEDRARSSISAFKKAVSDAFPVDYEKTFFQVCKDFLKFAIKRSDSLDIICRPWAPINSGVQLPSWIPMLSGTAFRPDAKMVHSRVKADSLVGLPMHGKGNYNAARKFPLNKNSHFRIGEEAENGSLFVDGFVLDRIAEKALPALQGNVPLAWLELAGWKDPSTAPPDAFWRTLIADRDADGKNPPLYYELACQQAFAQRAVEDDLPTHRLILANSRLKAVTQKVVVEYLQRVQSIVWMRRLIKTENKSALGLVPDLAKKGDLICILSGCSVPVLLREINDMGPSRVCHELIGECYIHGMMDGEALRVKQSQNIQIRNFEVR